MVYPMADAIWDGLRANVTLFAANGIKKAEIPPETIRNTSQTPPMLSASYDPSKPDKLKEETAYFIREGFKIGETGAFDQKKTGK